MNKLKKYIYRGCALLSLSSIIAGGSYVYTHDNMLDCHNKSLYANKTSNVQFDDNSKYEKKGTVVNVESILNVREEPSMDSPVDDTLDIGEVVKILDEKEGWYKIEKDSSAGYVKSDYLDEHDTGHDYEIVSLDNKTVIDEQDSSDLEAENLSVTSHSKAGNSTESQIREKQSAAMETTSTDIKATEVPRGKLINVELTAYCNDKQCSDQWGGTTTMGTETRVGVVAAPSNISLGSKLYIPDLSYYKNDAIFNVEDRGGAVKMKDDGTYVIDVWFPTHEQVEQFGRVCTTAYILE